MSSIGTYEYFDYLSYLKQLHLIGWYFFSMFTTQLIM